MGYFWPKFTSMEPIKIKTEQIREWSNEFRLIYPETVRNMALSMQSNGQLQPLILLRNDEGYHIIDGIKRYRAALELDIEELESLVFEVNIVMAKAMIVHYNRHNSSLSMYEQGLIVHSMVHDHGLSQKEVAKALRQSHSWVCRRLSLIERLLPEVQDAIRMGSITVTHGRELAKLPRGNQRQMLAVIIHEGLTSRECTILVEKLLKAKNPQETEYLCSQSREVIREALHGDKLYDSRLSVHGNRLLKARELLRLQINILTGALESEYTVQLPVEQQAMVLPAMSELVSPMSRLTDIIHKALKSYER
jgi:ParB family transcriptional regulator, chromosome partitioning protein